MLDNRSLESPYQPDDGYQLGSMPQPSLSLSPLVGDPDKFWQSGDSGTFEYTDSHPFNDGSESGVSPASHAYGEVDLGLLDSGYNIEEMDYDTLREDGTLSPSPVDYQSSRSAASIDPSHILWNSPTSLAMLSEVTKRPTEFFEEIGAQFVAGSPTNHQRLSKDLSSPIPRVVVSDTTGDNVSREKKSAASGSSAIVTSVTTHFCAKPGPSQTLHTLVAPRGSNRELPAAYGYRPTNYEVATHDRQPPCTMTTGEEPQTGTLAAETLTDFYADADFISANIAAASNIAVGRRRLPSDLATLQIPPKTPSRSQFQHFSPGLRHSVSQNSLQIPEYPTPSSSFGGLANHSQLDGIQDRDRPPSTPVTPSCFSPNQLPSPISRSPSNPPDAVGGMTYCPDCPDHVFKGTPEAQKNSLQRHRRDQHNGLPRLPCLAPGCPRSFAPGRKDNRLKHVRAMHPEVRLPAPVKRRKRKADD